jgi:endonuclease G
MGSALPLSSFALSIDAVEKITGRDFFPNLTDTRENTLEKSLQIQRWNFN